MMVLQQAKVSLKESLAALTAAQKSLMSQVFISISHKRKVRR